MQLVCATHTGLEAVARCVNCGLHLCSRCRRLDGVRNFCSECRSRLNHIPPPLPPLAPITVAAGAAALAAPMAVSIPLVPAARVPARKSPFLAASLSLVPGLGQAYSGRLIRGAAFFGSAIALKEVAWVSPLLAAFLYVFNLFDAWRLADGRNEKNATGHASARFDDTLFLLLGLGVLVATLLGLGGFVATPHAILLQLAALATGLVIAHETRR